MLRKFKVNVNGKEYMVELEEIGGAPTASAPVTVAAQPAPAPVVQEQPKAAPQATAPAPGDTAEVLQAPMPGNILDIKVKVGDRVELEQTLVILEAMKMENELVAPKAGTIKEIFVTANTPIDVGQPILTIE